MHQVLYSSNLSILNKILNVFPCQFYRNGETDWQPSFYNQPVLSHVWGFVVVVTYHLHYIC